MFELLVFVLIAAALVYADSKCPVYRNRNNRKD